MRWANLYADSIGDTGQALAITAGTNAISLTAGDLTLYDDNNNADTSISLGTSATEALVVQALNGGSNKTLEELRFTTKTASGTANHGKMSFYVDEVNIGNINDAGITLESGMVFTGNVTGNASGTAATVTGGTQAAITTCANLVTVGTIGTGVWQGTDVGVAHGGTGLSTVGTSQILTGNGTGALTSEANLTFDGSTLAVTGAADVSGDFTAGTVNADSDTAASDKAAMGYTTAEGLILTGQGSTNDVTIKNDADGTVLEIATGGTDVEVTSGNLIIGTSGKGIDFAATSDASGASSEVLDDYEEGTWTAVITDGSNAATLSNATGTYTKVGRLVTVAGYFPITSLGSMSGNAKVTGLPFNSTAGTEMYTAGSISAYNLNITAGYSMTINTEVNTDFFYLHLWDLTTGVGQITAAELSADGLVIIGLTYTA